MTRPRRLPRWLRTIVFVVALTVALVSLPLSLFVSGRARNEQQHRLCVYSLHQWNAGHRTIIRFTAPGSDDRRDAFDIAGPRPRC